MGSVGDRVKVEGGSCVPSSLVWVSVPPSASASSSAPGSLNGLSLREEKKRVGAGGRVEREASKRRPFSTGTKEGGRGSTDGDEAANQSLRTILQQSRLAAD